MSTIRNPVGPQPPNVYWRRRLLVGIGIVAAIIVIILIVVRPGSTPTGDKTPVPDSSVSGTPTFPSNTATPNAGNACDPAAVTVEAVTDATEYAAGVQPMISMKITNTSAGPCTIDVGTAAQEYIITSGEDRIWSSKDCQTDPAAAPTPFNAAETKTTTPFAWDRTRSSTDTCQTVDRQAAVANADGPTYRLQVKLGDVESEQASFRLFG